MSSSFPILLPFSLLLFFTSFYVLYYFFFAIVYLSQKKKKSPIVEQQCRFLILIPAHNEEETLPKALDSISGVRYPKSLVRVVVIADNCDDQTCMVAINRGATCLIRNNRELIGKGYALNWALDNLHDKDFDVVVMIDADTQLHPDFLFWMNNAFQKGAAVAQGFNHTSSGVETPLTRLMEITSYLKNALYYGGKSKIGLSAALMGTGMAFHREIILNQGWNAYSVGEDWEQTCLLAREGIPIFFVEQAITYSEEAATFKLGYSQRLRWAGGKFQIAWRHGAKLLIEGLRQREKLKVDVGLTILAPNYSLLLNLTIILLGVSFLFQGPFIEWMRTVTLSLVGIQSFYLILGLLLMRPSLRSLSSIMVVPAFLLWKFYIDCVSLLKIRKMKWVKTSRG